MEKAVITVWLEEPIIERDGDFYVAHSEQMQLSECGLTEAEAERNLQNAIITSCKALMVEGVLFETLEQKNIVYRKIVSPKVQHKGTLKPLLVGV